MEIESDLEAGLLAGEFSLPIRWDVHLARWISWITSPPLVGLLGLVLTAITIGSRNGWIWAGYYCAITILAPVAYIIWKLQTGEISDFHMQIRSQRIRPMLLMVGCALTAWVGLWLGKAPDLFIIFGGMGFFQVALLLMVTLKWKISGHSAAIASFSIFLWGLYGTPAILSTLAVPLVAWARVRLNRHTLMQTIAGSITGFVFMLAVFCLIFSYCQGITLACVLP
jgi:membrane-associated phospholipid phosphatase